MKKATLKEREWVNDYFSVTGWTLEKDIEVLVFDTIEEVTTHLGYATKNKTYEEMESIVDKNRSVWFDGEKNHVYYLIVQ